MKWTSKTVLLISLCLCVSAVNAQSDLISFKKPRTIEVNYDAFDDITRIATPRLGLEPSVGCTGGFGLKAGFSFFGQKRRTPGTYIVSFECEHTRWVLLGNDEAVFLADGARVVLDGGRRSSNTSTLGNRLTTWELLTFAIERGDLWLIANAKDVKLRVGPVEATLSAEDKKFINEVLDAASMK
jgi:hypothetical protein